MYGTYYGNYQLLRTPPQPSVDFSYGSASPGVVGDNKRQKNMQSKTARCIVGSAASDHTISKMHHTKLGLQFSRSPETAMNSQTANMSVNAHEVVDYHVADLGTKTTKEGLGIHQGKLVIHERKPGID